MALTGAALLPADGNAVKGPPGDAAGVRRLLERQLSGSPVLVGLVKVVRHRRCRAAEADAPALASPTVRDAAKSAPETARTLTTASPLAQAWVEERLGLPWNPGQTYALSAEEYSDLRALLAEFDVLLLDEPFKGLDAETYLKVTAYVREEIRGRTAILVSHDPRDVERLGGVEFRL